MKYFNKINIATVSGVLLGMMSCTDFSDYNTAPGESSLSAGQTLWQNIQSNPDLSQFATIVKKVGFDSNLDSPRFYTVFAPKNDTFNADSVLELDDAQILKEFVKQHIVEYNHPVNNAIEEDATLLSLNAKSHSFSSTAYGDAFYTENINQPSSNGVMHIVGHSEGFYNNIYEYFDKVEGCNLFRDYVKQYDEKYIDESNSVLGSVVHGEQTYDYIEYAHRNNVVNQTMEAQLENEDSSYTVLFPNDEAWQKSYDRISKGYNYIGKISYMNFSTLNFPNTAGATIDATIGKSDITVSAPEYLADSLTKYSMVRNLAFSHCYDTNEVLRDGNGTVEDTLYTCSKHYLVSAEDVEEHTVENYKMSNGYVRIVDSIPFQPWQTFEPVLVTRSIGRVLMTAGSAGLFTNETMSKSEIRNSATDTLFNYVPQFIYDRMLTDKYSDDENFRFVTTTELTLASAPELDFALRGGVRSTKYHIYVVTMPDQIYDNEERTSVVRPYYLRFWLNYTDASNKQVKTELKLSETAIPTWGPRAVTEKISGKNVTSIVTKPGYVNVIDLGEFEFPICYENTEAYPNLMMCHTQSFGTAAKRNKYEQNMRVAGVYMFPVEADAYFKSYNNGIELHNVVE